MEKAKVEKKILTAYNILYRTMVAYHRAKYLNIGDSAKERKAVRSNSFINHARFALWYLAVVEACKLFQNSSNQKYNLHKLFNILQDNQKKAYLKGNITSTEIKDWRTRLNSPENSRTIGQLINLRDQLYAHTDDVNELFPEENTPLYQHLEDLFQAAQQILSEIASKVLDAHLDFRPPDLYGTKAVLGLIVAEQDRMRQEAEKDILEMRRRIKGA
jgi:hypothetical protein